MAAEGSNELVRVVTLLGSAVIAVPLFKRLGLGSVLGYLAAGLLIGPFGLKLFSNPQQIVHLAELGVVMFLFVIGLEMKPAHLWSLRRQIFGLGSMQVLLATVLMTLLGVLAFQAHWRVGFVCASGFVMTSTAIVMQVLSERHDLASARGQSMVSILLFEDLLIVPLLAVVTFLAPASATPDAGRTPLWQEIGIAALAFAALVAAGRWLLNPLFGILAKAKAREVMTAAALFVVLGAALLMEVSGLSMAMGAFVAGVLLSESSFRHQLEADIEPFRGLLLGLFFLGVGMSLDLHVVANNWKIVLSGVLLLMLVKGLCIYTVARVLKSSHADAIDRAFLMAQGGEFAFMIFVAAANQKVISETVHANMTAIVVLSMVLTPLAIIAKQRLLKTESAAHQSTVGVDSLENGEHALHGKVIIIGFGRVAQIASQAPIAYGAEISIIDNNPDVILGARNYGFKVYYGDGTRNDVLHAAGAAAASCIMICIANKEAANHIVENVSKHYPQAKILVRAYDRRHALALVQAKADVVIRETLDAAINLGNEAVKALGASEEEADEISFEVRRADSERFALELAGDEFAGRALLVGNVKVKAGAEH